MGGHGRGQPVGPGDPDPDLPGVPADALMSDLDQNVEGPPEGGRGREEGTKEGDGERLFSPHGISFDKEKELYEAYVYNHGGKTRLGWFADERQAARAAVEGRRLFGHPPPVSREADPYGGGGG